MPLQPTCTKYKEAAGLYLPAKDKLVKMGDINKPPKRYPVEGFYLADESLFEKNLKGTQ